MVEVRRIRPDDAARFRSARLAALADAPSAFASTYERSDGHDPRLVELVSMWVAPSHRRLAVGRRLVDEIVGWARGTGAASVGLWVTLGNEPAERLYRKAGFHDTDEYQPLPSGPCQPRTVALGDRSPEPGRGVAPVPRAGLRSPRRPRRWTEVGDHT